MTFKTRLLLAGLALTAATGAQAEHAVIYAPSTNSFASAQAHQGPYVQFSTANVRDTKINDLYAGPGGTATHGPLSTTSSSVAATLPGGSGDYVFGSSASASANLAAGTLKASVGAYGPDFFGGPLGFATAELSDTIYFTNSTGGDLSVTFRYSFDGSVIDSNGSSYPGGLATLQLGCDYWLCYNGNGLSNAIRFAKSGDQVGDNIHAFFDENGISLFARNIYGDQYKLFNQFDVWNGSVGGAIDGWIQTTLLIPTGQTSLGLLARLSLDCRGGSNCDFSHTGTFGLVGDLPEGLTMGSASGVFLTAVPGTGVGGVPEPATWAMLIFGFGAVGVAARRQRALRVTA